MKETENGKDFSLAEVKLWQIPQGSIVELTKQEMEDNGYESDKWEMPDKIEAVVADRYYDDGSIHLFFPDSKQVGNSFSVADTLIEGKEFNFVSPPTKNTLELLLEYYKALALQEMLDNGFFITLENKYQLEIDELIRKIDNLKKLIEVY